MEAGDGISDMGRKGDAETGAAIEYPREHMAESNILNEHFRVLKQDPHNLFVKRPQRFQGNFNYERHYMSG